MTIVATTRIPESVATRVRFLKGSLAYLLEELLDTCSEEGIPCSGLLRKQLTTQLHELRCYFLAYPRETGYLLEDAEALLQIMEQLDGPEVTTWQLRDVRQKFLGLSHPVPNKEVEFSSDVFTLLPEH